MFHLKGLQLLVGEGCLLVAHPARLPLPSHRTVPLISGRLLPIQDHIRSSSTRPRGSAPLCPSGPSLPIQRSGRKVIYRGEGGAVWCLQGLLGLKAICVKMLQITEKISHDNDYNDIMKMIE